MDRTTDDLLQDLEYQLYLNKTYGGSLIICNLLQESIDKIIELEAKLSSTKEEVV